MPNDDRGSLNDKTCIEIVAYILQVNGFPGGSEELAPDAETLSNIQLVKKPQYASGPGFPAPPLA